METYQIAAARPTSVFQGTVSGCHFLGFLALVPFGIVEGNVFFLTVGVWLDLHKK